MIYIYRTYTYTIEALMLLHYIKYTHTWYHIIYIYHRMISYNIHTYTHTHTQYRCWCFRQRTQFPWPMTPFEHSCSSQGLGEEEDEEGFQRTELLTRVVLVPVVAALFYWSKNVGNVVYSREIAQDAPVIMWCINIQSVYNVHEKSSVWVVTQTMSHTQI